jgi:hypothetical protein
VAQHDLVDIVRTDTGMIQSLERNLGDQTFERLPLELAETRMGPTYDASSHDYLLRRRSVGGRPLFKSEPSSQPRKVTFANANMTESIEPPDYY